VPRNRDRFADFSECNRWRAVRWRPGTHSFEARSLRANERIVSKRRRCDRRVRANRLSRAEPIKHISDGGVAAVGCRGGEVPEISYRGRERIPRRPIKNGPTACNTRVVILTSVGYTDSGKFGDGFIRNKHTYISPISLRCPRPAPIIPPTDLPLGTRSHYEPRLSCWPKLPPNLSTRFMDDAPRYIRPFSIAV